MSYDLKISVHASDSMGNVYRLEEQIKLCWGNHYIEVPNGFESDGASVPRFLWRVVFPPGDSKALFAAFCHDYVYRTHPAGWTKELADLMFRDLLIERGVPRVRAELAYLGVKLFGRKSWEGAAHG